MNDHADPRRAAAAALGSGDSARRVPAARAKPISRAGRRAPTSTSTRPSRVHKALPDAQAAGRCDAPRASRAPLPDAAARRLRDAGDAEGADDHARSRRHGRHRADDDRQLHAQRAVRCRAEGRRRVGAPRPLAAERVSDRQLRHGGVPRADRCDRQAGDHADRHVDAEAHVARSASPPATPGTSAAASLTRRRTSRSCRSRTASATTSISTGSPHCTRRTASSCIGASRAS